MMDFTYYLDDKWWLWLWHHFSFIMVMIPSAVGIVLKIVAVKHPDVPTDKIIDLFKLICRRPG